MRPTVRIFEDPAQVAVEFANLLGSLLPSRPQFHLALSGGSTPKLLFDRLAQEYRESIDWSKLHLYWGDERCVSPAHSDSNYGMTRDHLLQKVPIPESNVHRIMGENDPHDEKNRYSDLLLANTNPGGSWPMFDMIILGMGADGHTASIFPDQMSLLTSDRICEVVTHPETGQKRITLTGRAINQSRRVSFLVTGEEKATKISEIMSQTGNWRDYPAAHIAPSDGDLSWYLDRAAAPSPP